MKKVTFKIEGERNGRHIEDTCTMELLHSEAFKYGNGTCVSVEYESGYNFVIDTRYEYDLNEENFRTWAANELRKRTAPEFKISYDL